MKKYFLGIDLGSTTSKAIIVDETERIIGRGITNTRANYLVATEVARLEAIYNARFSLLKMKLEDEIESNPEYKKYIKDLESVFQYLQFKQRLDRLNNQFIDTIQSSFSDIKKKEDIAKKVEKIVNTIGPEIRQAYLFSDLGSKNQFFRDIVSERYNNEINKLDKDYFDPLMLVYDKSITPVENELTEYDFKELIFDSMDILNDKYSKLDETFLENTDIKFDSELNLLRGNYNKIYNSIKDHIQFVANLDIHISDMVGTGYGRALLPFPEKSIKSEILCHAFGAHAVFPNTRTVLDIGGQDTKAIQVDGNGLVTSFHMNDRCAAGCGRYLGYIADEFSISLNELGPLALEAKQEVNICSTCTVFAGAEIRELLNVGQKRSDILAGLHKAIVMRAMSLLARSGGVRNEFSFTGGVARNQAVLKYVSDLVRKNYGDNIKINIHSDSIFMGALGGALFAKKGFKN